MKYPRLYFNDKTLRVLYPNGFAEHYSIHGAWYSYCCWNMVSDKLIDGHKAKNLKEAIKFMVSYDKKNNLKTYFLGEIK